MSNTLKERGYKCRLMFNSSCDKTIYDEPSLIHIYTKIIDTTELVIRVFPDGDVDFFVDPGKQIRWSRDIDDLEGSLEVLENDLRSVGMGWVIDKQYECEFKKTIKAHRWTGEKKEEK